MEQETVGSAGNGSASVEVVKLGWTAAERKEAEERVAVRDGLDRRGSVELRIRLPWKIHTQLGLMAKLEDLNQSEMLEVLVEEGFARRSEMVQEFFSIGGKG